MVDHELSHVFLPSSINFLHSIYPISGVVDHIWSSIFPMKVPGSNLGNNHWSIPKNRFAVAQVILRRVWWCHPWGNCCRKRLQRWERGDCCLDKPWESCRNMEKPWVFDGFSGIFFGFLAVFLGFDVGINMGYHGDTTGLEWENLIIVVDQIINNPRFHWIISDVPNTWTNCYITPGAFGPCTLVAEGPRGSCLGFARSQSARKPALVPEDDDLIEAVEPWNNQHLQKHRTRMENRWE